MNRHRKRVFAAALAVAVAGTSFNITSFAVSADSSKDGRVITAFEELDSEIAYQYLPVGSHESDIVFPEELKVRVYSEPKPEDSEPEKEKDVPEMPENTEPEEPSSEPEKAPEEPAPAEPLPEETGEPAPEVPEQQNPEVPEQQAPEEGQDQIPEVPENPAPEAPESTEPVSDGEGELSGAIKNIFGLKTVYAAEGGEGAPEGEEERKDETAPEEAAKDESAPEEPSKEETAPEEPAKDEAAPEEPSKDEGEAEKPADEEQVSDNSGTTPSEDEAKAPVEPETKPESEILPGESEKTLTNVRWKLVKDESAYRSFEALLEGDIFVYEPDVSRYPVTVEAPLPKIRVTITAKEGGDKEKESVSGDGVSKNSISPGFSRMMITGGVRIKVEAPEGVFPEGAEISVKKIDDPASAEKIKSTVGESANVAAFDITVKDVSGNEIQPNTEYGTVTVTFENVNIVKDSAANEGAQVSVYHFEEGLEGGQKLETEVNKAEGSAAVEAGHFSPFVVVVEGMTEQAAGSSDFPSMPLKDIPKWLLDNKWVVINGLNSGPGKDAIWDGPVFDTLSFNKSKDECFLVSDDKVLIKLGVNNTYKNSANEIKEFKFDGFDTYYADGRVKVMIYANYNGTVKEDSYYVYPKLDSYDYTVSLNSSSPSSPREMDFSTNPGYSYKTAMEKDIHTSIRQYKGEIVSQANSFSDAKSELPGTAYDEKYVYYRVDGVERETSTGEYIIPANPAKPGKDKYKYTPIASLADVYDPGVYAATAKVTIYLANLDQGNKQKVLRNTLSADAGGHDKPLVITDKKDKGTVEGVFFHIRTISIDEVFKPGTGKIAISSGTVPYDDRDNGYKIFSKFDSTFNPYPSLNDPDDNVRFTIKEKNTGKVVKEGRVTDNPDPRLMDPGEYQIEIDATGSKHYKGKYGPVDSLTITKRSLSDNTCAGITVSPNQFYVSEVSKTNKVEAPVLVTWTSPKSSLKKNLIEGKDYKLQYDNNDREGTATVTAIGIGDYYTGKISTTFEIIVTKKIPTILYREELDVGEPSATKKEWYNTGVKLSAKKEGDVTYDVRIGPEGDYKSETDPFKEEGSNQKVNLYLKSKQNTYYNAPQYLNIDLTDPVGTIMVDGSAGVISYNGLNNDGTIAQYIKSSAGVTAQGSDGLSGVAKLEYFITDSPSVRSLSTLKQMSDDQWTSFAGKKSVPVEVNKNSFIYLRVKDNAGNTGFASAKGICYDTINPVLSKADVNTDNNKLRVTFTATDELSGVGKYYALLKKSSDPVPSKDAILKSKTVSTNASFIVGNASDAKNGVVVYCVVTDKAGNVSDIKKAGMSSDTKSPTGTIKVMDKQWDSVQSKENVVLYTNEKQLISMTGADSSSGVKKIQYYVTSKCYTTAASIASSISKNAWKTYSDEARPEIEHNVLNYVYERISDNSGNYGYVTSEGIWHDAVKPKNDKIATSKITDKSVTVTITGSDEHSGIGTYYAVVRKADQEAPDAKAVESGGTKSEKNSFEVKGLVATSSYKVYGVIKDKAGNLSDVKSAAFSTTKAADGSGSKKNGKGASKNAAGSKSKSSKDKQKEAADAYRKQAGISSGQAGSGSGVDSVAIPSRIPYIKEATEGIAKGEELTSGWQKILGESSKAPEPAEVHIQMNGATVVPASVLKTIENKNITMYFEMNDDFIWAINGLSFTEDPKADIDLRVRKDTKNIPADMVNKVADVYPHTCISLEHNGDFGFKGILSIPFGTDNAGMYSNMYYYNEPANKLEFVDSSEVNSGGRSEFEFTHASDYVVVLRSDALTDKTAGALDDSSSVIVPDSDNTIDPSSGLLEFFSPANKYLWILIVTLLSLALCGFVMFAPDDRKRQAA